MRNLLQSTKALSRLYCYYKMDRPYLRLAPIKVEIARQNPMAVLFHDIMSDEESRIIEMLAVPKVRGSNCGNNNSIGTWYYCTSQQ